MHHEVVHVRHDGAVAVITLSRPESLNAISHELAMVLGGVLAEAAASGRVRALVLTGEGRAFCAGGDVREFVAHLDTNPAAFLGELVSAFHEHVILPLRRMPKPVIAAINGVTAGGGVGLALACDLRVASAGARFTLAYPNIGLTVDGGSSFFLPRLVGMGRAIELMLLAEALDAQEALRVGLVNRVVDPDELLPQAIALATRLADGPAAAFAMIKELMDLTYRSNLPTQLQAELERIVAAASTADHAEGIRAFVQKRKPAFQGR